MQEPLLSLKEVATWLGVSERTVMRLRSKGELSPYMVGGVLRFEPREVRIYLHRSLSRTAARPWLQKGEDGRFVSEAPR